MFQTEASRLIRKRNQAPHPAMARFKELVNRRPLYRLAPATGRPAGAAISDSSRAGQRAQQLTAGLVD